jgi:glycosyltransferase involved in cell wall biosynthesis
LRIALVSDYYAPIVGGGVERVVEEVAVRLAQLGHEVRVVTMNLDGYPDREIRRGVEVLRIPAIGLQSLLGIPSAIHAGLRINRYLEGVDVIHVHNLYFLLSLSTFLSRPDAPIITTLHLGSLKRLPTLAGAVGQTYESTIGRRLLRRSDAVTAVSQAVADHATAVDPFVRAEVIPNTVDTTHFRPPPNGTNGGTQSILFLGRFVWNKGPQFIVKSMPRVVSAVRDVEFHFVGEGPLRNWIVRRLDRLDLARFTRFQGWADDAAPVLQSASVVVRPSLTEGMPLAVMEAMACGRTVVASRVAGTSDIIRDGDTGVLVEPGSVGSLSEGLLRVLTDRGLSQVIGRRAHDWAERLPSWEVITKRYLSVYEEVAS